MSAFREVYRGIQTPYRAAVVLFPYRGAHPRFHPVAERVPKPLGGHSLVEDQTRIYRRLFGRFVTGVAVVLTEEDGEVKGLTINSLTSASLDPLLLLFCVRNKSTSGDAILRVRRFTVSILGAHQENAARHFAGRKDPQPSLSFARDDGFVWLEDSNAVFRCAVADAYPGGDHRIILGRVVDMLGPEACAQLLVYHSGDYAHLAAVSRTKEGSLA